MNQDVVIVGAGLSGLCCARVLQRQGIGCKILEASDGVGGRIRTDIVDGFRLDRGFQVFLTSYPEAKSVLDYQALQLKPFLAGALIRYGGQFYELSDPWRRPLAALRSLRSPIGSFADKLRVARFRSKTLKGTIEERFRDPETTSLKELQDAGFSAAMIDRFFRPFLGGIFLDSELRTSSRMLNFVFRMFSLGDACLPAEGMDAIPRQIAAALAPNSIRFGARVARVKSGSVELSTGEELDAKSIVVAVEGNKTSELLSETTSSTGQGTTCIYFSATRAPIEQSLLVLNGDGRGPINNLCVPTNVAASYGTGHGSLVSVTVIGTTNDDARLLSEVREQLSQWFGNEAKEWQHLKTYAIPYALPAQLPPALSVAERPVRWKPGIYICGDHRDNASIQGAMVSGRRVAEALIEDLGYRTNLGRQHLPLG